MIHIDSYRFSFICGAFQSHPYLEFYVANVQMKSTYNYTSIECQFELTRDPFKHLTMTYVPTLFISVMSLMSLFIDDSHFDSNIMVSLTCMLVLYTLYQSIEGVMPETAYMKLLGRIRLKFYHAKVLHVNISISLILKSFTLIINYFMIL